MPTNPTPPNRALIANPRIWLGLSTVTVLAILIAAIVVVSLTQKDEETLRESQRADTAWLERTMRVMIWRLEQDLLNLAEVIGADPGDRKRQRKAATLAILARYPMLESVSLYNEDGEFVDLLAGNAVWPEAPAFSREAYILARHADAAQSIMYGWPYQESKTQGSETQLPPVARQSWFDLYVPVPVETRSAKSPTLTVTMSLNGLVAQLVPDSFSESQEITLLLPDKSIAAVHALAGKGRGKQVSDAKLELPGLSLTIRADAVSGIREEQIRWLLVAVGLLGLMVFASLAMLRRDFLFKESLERRLRDEVAMRKAMEDSLIVGLRARDGEGRITYVSKAFCEMVGWRADELIGLAPPEPYWAPEMLARAQERRKERAQGHWSLEGYESVFVHRDGRRIDILAYETPLIDADGRQTGWMTSVIDITDRKKIEALSRKQQERLTHTAQLSALGELASMIAHELNQPLAAITSYATACQNFHAQHAQPDTRVQEGLQRISSQAKRSGEVLSSLLDFVRRRSPKPARVAVHSLVAHVRPILDLMATKSSSALTIDIDPQLPEIEVDPPLIEQVIVNLARNGFQAIVQAPSGRRRLTLLATWVCALPSQQEMIEFSVADDGVGIPESAMKELFSPFFTTRDEGLGLGLNLSRSIVERHGGQLWIEDNPTHFEGYQTIFRFTLPLSNQMLHEEEHA